MCRLETLKIRELVDRIVASEDKIRYLENLMKQQVDVNEKENEMQSDKKEIVAIETTANQTGNESSHDTTLHDTDLH